MPAPTEAPPEPTSTQTSLLDDIVIEGQDAADDDELSGDAAVASGVIYHQVWNLLVPDPIAAHDDNQFPFGEVYSGLVRIGDAPDGEPQPGLASGWSISDDGLRYTFTLRDDLRFSNGAPLEVDDVKWSWERALLSGNRTQRTSLVFGAIVGAQEMLEDQARTLAGVSTIDDSTLVVELTRPLAHFPYLLADPLASVLDRDNVGNWGTLNWVRFLQPIAYSPSELLFRELPVGTGPFRIASTDEVDAVILEPNPYYWRGPPAIEAMHYQLAYDRYAEEFTEFHEWTHYDFVDSHLEQVEVMPEDSFWTIDGISTEGYDGFAAPGAPEAMYLALNTAVAPFDDLDFRRSLLAAAGYSKIAELSEACVFEEQDEYLVSEMPTEAPEEILEPQYLPTHCPIPPLFGGLLPPGFPGGRSAEDAPRTDRDAALENLRASGYSGVVAPPPIELFDSFPSVYNAFVVDFTADWQEWLGVTVVDQSLGGMTPEEFDALMDDQGYVTFDLSDSDALLAAGNLQTRFVSAKPRYPDPCAILCYIPDLFGPKAQSDETEQLRTMLDAAATIQDRAARIAEYQRIEQHILDRALVIPVFYADGNAYRLHRPYISGYKVPAYGGSQFEDVVVDTAHPDYPPERLSPDGGQ